MIATLQFQHEPLRGDIEPPSSKNYTTRYVLASCLAEGRSVVHKPAIQDDAAALVRCCRRLGATIVARDESGAELEFCVGNATRIDRLEIEGFGGNPRVDSPEKPIDPDNAGAVLRLLLGVGAVIEGGVAFDTAHYKHSLGTRPNRDLLDAFAQLGVVCEAMGEGGTLPIRMAGGRSRIGAHLGARREREGMKPGDPVPVRISGAVSSQFLSALLFMAPLLDECVRIEVVDDLKSKPLIRTTLAVLADGGVSVEAADDLMSFVVRPGQKYKAREWSVNGDWPGTAAILAAAAVVPRSSIRLSRLRDDEQGERRCLDLYRQMGCTAEWKEGALIFSSPERLGRGEIDGDTCTDAVPAMMGAASLGEGETVFTGIANLQYKECDRVREPIAEMRGIFATGGGEATWEPGDAPRTIRVTGCPDGFGGGIAVDGRGDHRVIMLLSVMAMRCRGGLSIRGAEHVAKSFPLWFETLRRMGAKVALTEEETETAHA